MSNDAPPTRSRPIDLLLGRPGESLACKVFSRSPEVSVHWWPSNAKPGDKCMCGERKMRAPATAAEDF